MIHDLSEPALEIVILEDDLSPGLVAQLKTERQGAVVLGTDGASQRRLRDEIARRVIERVSRMVPPGYQVAEMSLKFAIGGELLGMKLGGDVLVKITPVASSPSKSGATSAAPG